MSLPIEVLSAKLFPFLPIEDVLRSKGVSRAWRDAADLEVQARARQIFGDSPEAVNKFIALCRAVKGLEGFGQVTIEMRLRSIGRGLLGLTPFELSPVLIEFLQRAKVWEVYQQRANAVQAGAADLVQRNPLAPTGEVVRTLTGIVHTVNSLQMRLTLKRLLSYQ